MAAVILRRIRQQRLRSLFKAFPVSALSGIQLHEVKAAHQYIRLKPARNIQYAPVGTAADEHPLSIFTNGQVLLVPEIIRAELAALAPGQPGAVKRHRHGHSLAAVQRNARAQLRHALNRHDAPALGKRGIHADIALLAMVMRAKGMAADVYRSVVVDFKEAHQSAAVVIMPVGEDRKIHLRQVNTHLQRVFGKGVRLSRVKENAPVARFNVQTQSMLGGPRRGKR